MDVLPELVVDLQASSAHGAAQMFLSMCLAHVPTLNIDEVTTGIPKDSNPDKLMDAYSGYDTRITRRVRHDAFYDKVVLPANEALEAEAEKEREEEARPDESEDDSLFTWTSFKEAKRTNPRPTMRVLLLRPRMLRSKEFVLAEKNMNNASFGPFVGLQYKLILK
jgi:hypothetical protein